MKYSRLGLLDGLFILVTSLVLALTLFWIASVLRGEQIFSEVPEWLAGAADRTWTFVTAGGAAALVLAWLRRRTAPRARTPNYALLIPSTTLALILVSLGLAWGLRWVGMDEEMESVDLEVQFGLHFKDPENPHLDDARVRFAVRKPPGRRAQYISQQADGLFAEYVGGLPVEQSFDAVIMRVVKDSYRAESEPTELCFRLLERPLGTGRGTAKFQCDEGGRCELHPEEDPSRVRLCGDEEADLGGGFLVSPLFGDTGEGASWLVPSLETLASMKEAGELIGVGYTVFEVSSHDLQSYGADSFTYAIEVNGVPVRVDGLEPHLLSEPLAPDGALELRFALQNLGFSGADNGCEGIRIDLTLYAEQRQLASFSLARQYVALRDPWPEQIESSGVEFSWTGRYVQPAGAFDREVFLFSSPDVQASARTKRAFDRLGLEFDGYPVVGVLRPPYRTEHYSMVAGLRLPSGQIRFVLPDNQAEGLRGYLDQEPAVASTVREPFLWKVTSGSTSFAVPACAAD